MRKLYFVLLLLCVVSTAAFAQLTTRVLYASGPAGSGKTGSTTASVLTEGTLEVVGNLIPPTTQPTRGWAVFNLSSIPADAVITSAVIGFHVAAYTPGMGSTYNTYGYVGDISGLGTAAATWPAMVTPTSTFLTNASYQFGTGNKILPSVAATVAFVQANLGGDISITFTTTTSRVYGITDETGTLDTSGVHAPYLMVSYTCPGVSGVTASATPTIVCPGGAVTLTGNAVGAVSYSWTAPSGTLSSATTATDNPTAATTYTFAATSGSGTGCGTERLVTVNMNPVPSAVATASGATAICIGSTVDVLVSAPVGGDTYQWYEAGIAISGATNSLYTVSATGNYAVQVTNTTGCSDMSSGIPVLVLDVPTLTPAGAVSLCTATSGSTLLTVNTGGVTSGLTYQWKKDGVAIAGATNSTYSATASGSYVAEVSTTSGGCVTTSTATVVTISPFPNPGITYNGSVATTSTGFINYQWFLNSVAIPGATANNYIPTTNGGYRVKVTNTYGCVGYSSELTIGNVGVQEVNVENISIFPNPATNIVRVDAAYKVNVAVTSVDGRTLIDQKNAKEINVAHLANGVYLIRVYDEQGQQLVTKKLVKE